VNTSKESIKTLVYWYENQKRGLKYAAKQAGYSEMQAKRILKEQGIHIRTQREAAILANKNRVSDKNFTYFSKENESSNMAWLLGFLASDGTIAKRDNTIKIGLAIKDKEILEKIRQELNLQTEVKEYVTADGYDCCSLTWTCEQHKKDLAYYNIIPQKTFNLIPPYNLNRKYWIDYIRGYFDGDGSVNLITNGSHRGNGNLRWQICSATKEILQFIIDFFYEEYNISKVNIQQQERVHTLYYFQYSSAATRQIYNILYTPNAIYLRRKKERFEEILKQVTPLK